MRKVKTADEAAKLVRDGSVVAVNSSSGLCCPDAVLKALGERFDREGHPRGLTSVHPIAAGVLSPADLKGSLAELCSGTVRGRRSRDDITLFKAVGTALADLATAGLAYNARAAEGPVR